MLPALACAALCALAPGLPLSTRGLDGVTSYHAIARARRPVRMVDAPPPGAADADDRLLLVEHTMPIMDPELYEEALRSALHGRGEIVRWYIGRVDEAARTVRAEVVLLPP